MTEERQITITRARLVELHWRSHGQVRGGRVEPEPELFQIWFNKMMLGFASEPAAAILLAEQLGRRLNCEVRDLILESSSLDEGVDWHPHG